MSSNGKSLMEQGREEDFVTDFSADYQLRYAASGTVLESVRVQIATHGMKLVQLLGERRVAIALNTDTDQLWLSDLVRRVSLEVPMTVRQSSGSKDVSDWRSLESPAPEAPEVAAFAPFLQFQPCLYMNAELVTETWLRGRQVQVWKCSVDEVLVETQWFDTSLSVVVKGASEDGYVSELLNVKEVMLSSEHFSPSSDFRVVTFNEFMSEPEQINHYQEKAR